MDITNIKDKFNMKTINQLESEINKLKKDISNNNKKREININDATRLFNESNNKIDEIKIIQKTLDEFKGKNKFSLKMDNELLRYFIYFIFIILLPLIFIIFF